VSRVVITGTTAGVLVRVDSCPCCRRPLRLDHCGLTQGGEDYVDLDAVAFAQRLHLATCRG
jgi:hypothetical protein